MTISRREAELLKRTAHHKDVTQTLSHYVIKAMLKARRKNNMYKIPYRRQLPSSLTWFRYTSYHGTEALSVILCSRLAECGNVINQDNPHLHLARTIASRMLLGINPRWGKASVSA
jgi:exopolyphosphatase/pppGpp-phosphohydrolase